MLASFYKNIERLTYFLKKWALYIHLFCTPLYLIRHLRLLAALATCSRCARKMLLWIYGQWFSFSIYFFLNRVKDVNVNLVQCEMANHLVTFSRPQIPCACVFLFHFFSLFVSFFVFLLDAVSTEIYHRPVSGFILSADLDQKHSSGGAL